MISPRIAGAQTGILAYGESWYTSATYSGISGSLSIGMPVFVNTLDAAQYNTVFTNTALVSSSAPVQDCGSVILGVVAGSGASPTCIGVYQPENPSDKPLNQDTIRILVYGYGVVSAVAIASGTAVTVGANLLISSTNNNALVGAPVVKQNIGTVLATKSAITLGSSVIAVPGSGSTTALVNAFIQTS
jgi:hypothetical protein